MAWNLVPKRRVDGFSNQKVRFDTLPLVAHDDFYKVDFKELKESNTVIFDTKSFLDRFLVDARL
jgi:UDP-N-acetyl-D-mannosaminuronate dehydrogenase